MSKQSELIATAITAANATVSNLQQLQVDIAVLDAAVSTQLTHTTDAAAQAAADNEKVATATVAIGTDLQAVKAAHQIQDEAMDALSALSPPVTTTTDPNQGTTPAPEVTTSPPEVTADPNAGDQLP